MSPVFNASPVLGKTQAIDLKNSDDAHAKKGFSTLEAMLACALMALGLAAAVRLSMQSLSASQALRNLDMASAAAQDLGECWGVETRLCLQQFASSNATTSLTSNDPLPNWTRTWQESDILMPGASLGTLKELRVKVTWPEGDQTAELVWIKRRASTPTWVGS